MKLQLNKTYNKGRIKMKALKQFLALAVFAAALSSTAYAQYTQQWVSSYNNGTRDFARDMVKDASGNVYITGASNGSANTIKYNSAGVQQWAASYTGTGSEGKALTVDGSGNVYVAGTNNGFSEIVVLKYNSAGVQQWACIYTGTAPGSENVAGIRVDNSGNVYVGADSYTGEITFRDLVAIKIDPAGGILWASTYDAGSQNGEEASQMELDASGNVYICGSTFVTSKDAVITKWNNSGAVQWSKIINGTAAATDVGRCMEADAAGNVYFAASINNMSTFMDINIMKYNSAGAEQWMTSYNHSPNALDHPFDMALDGSGNIYITGVSFAGGAIDSGNIITAKFNNAGVKQWASIYNGPAANDDMGKSIAIDVSGNVYVAGYSLGIGTEYDFTIIKYSTGGAEEWVHRKNGPGNDEDIAVKVLVDNQYAVYAAGYVSSAQNSFDTYTVKFSPMSGIQLAGGEIPSSYSLSQNYPNPFNPVTNFEFSVVNSQSSIINLTVYDITGKEVAVLVNEPLKTGVYKYSFDGTKLNSGVYFYRLTAGGFSETKKMLLVK
jgi:hypothetical protein